MDKIIEFIKNYKVLLMIAVLLATAFYWYEWRPTQIKKECHNKAMERYIVSPLGLINPFQESDKAYGHYDTDYKRCLQEKGL